MDENTEQLHILLGCFGRTDDGFVSCSSCENDILLVHSGLDDYNKLMDFLDNYGLFDKPSFDFNAIRSVLQNIYGNFIHASRPLWSEKQVQLFQKFILEHKNCGLYLKLHLGEHLKKEIPEKTVTVPASSKINNKFPKLGIKLRRGIL